MLKIIKCSASWCKPCLQLDKVMNEILPSYDTNITYVKVDVEEDIDFAEEYQIRGVPTMLFEKDGVIVEKIVGLRSGSEIKSVIDKYI